MGKKTNFIERLIIESKELEEKFEKLDSFLKTSKFQALDSQNRTLLRNQRLHMESYLNILKERIDIIQKKG